MPASSSATSSAFQAQHFDCRRNSFDFPVRPDDLDDLSVVQSLPKSPGQQIANRQARGFSVFGTIYDGIACFHFFSHHVAAIPHLMLGVGMPANGYK
jgi:hypothetical protein